MKKFLSLVSSLLMLGCASTYKPEGLTENSPMLTIDPTSHATIEYHYSVINDPCGAHERQHLGVASGGTGLISVEDGSTHVKLKENKELVVRLDYYQKNIDMLTGQSSRNRENTNYFQFQPELGKHYRLSAIYGYPRLTTVGSREMPRGYRVLKPNFCEYRSKERTELTTILQNYSQQLLTPDSLLKLHNNLNVGESFKYAVNDGKELSYYTLKVSDVQKHLNSNHQSPVVFFDRYDDNNEKTSWVYKLDNKRTHSKRGTYPYSSESFFNNCQFKLGKCTFTSLTGREMVVETQFEDGVWVMNSRGIGMATFTIKEVYRKDGLLLYYSREGVDLAGDEPFLVQYYLIDYME